VCDEIFFVHVQQAMLSLHAVIFFKFPKNKLRCKYLIINNRNFEKSSRIPSKRTKVNIKKIILDTSQQKIGSAYAQSPRKCLNIQILAKIEGKESKFLSKITKDILGFDLGKKIQNYFMLVYL
jgi:hypothetical protein